MPRLSTLCAFASILVVVPAAIAGSGTVPGTWRKLRPAPFAVPQQTASVWTGRQLIVFGRRPATNPSVDVAEAYDPARDAWSRLSPPAAPRASLGYRAVWTGKEMLVFGAFHSVAFNLRTDKWRELRHSVPGGITVWTGREAIGWGGGCCGDADSNGAAYNPATNTFRKLARSPLAPEQQPIGAWTGHELVLVVSGISAVDGKPLPARLARAAAYNPATDSWRRITSPPQHGTRFVGTAVWDGREMLVVGTGAQGQSAFAFNPATNRWRRLAFLEPGHVGASAVWTGKRLLLWGGFRYDPKRGDGAAPHGLAYDPRTDRWSALPQWPLRARSGSTVVWTGRALLVWGGLIGAPIGTTTGPKYPADGAAFTPATQ
jgi:N-acetylneuraminic acid mutarotase